MCGPRSRKSSVSKACINSAKDCITLQKGGIQVECPDRDFGVVGADSDPTLDEILEESRQQAAHDCNTGKIDRLDDHGSIVPCTLDIAMLHIDTDDHTLSPSRSCMHPHSSGASHVQHLHETSSMCPYTCKDKNRDNDSGVSTGCGYVYCHHDAWDVPVSCPVSSAPTASAILPSTISAMSYASSLHPGPPHPHRRRRLHFWRHRTGDQSERERTPLSWGARGHIFGPERVVLDPRIKAVHRRVMRDILLVGFVWGIMFTVVVLMLPYRH